jgi:hypothetical protein
MYIQRADSKFMWLLSIAAGCCSSAEQHGQAVLPALEGLGGS